MKEERIIMRFILDLEQQNVAYLMWSGTPYKYKVYLKEGSSYLVSTRTMRNLKQRGFYWTQK